MIAGPLLLLALGAGTARAVALWQEGDPSSAIRMVTAMGLGVALPLVIVLAIMLVRRPPEIMARRNFALLSAEYPRSLRFLVFQSMVAVHEGTPEWTSLRPRDISALVVQDGRLLVCGFTDGAVTMLASAPIASVSASVTVRPVPQSLEAAQLTLSIAGPPTSARLEVMPGHTEVVCSPPFPTLSALARAINAKADERISAVDQ